MDSDPPDTRLPLEVTLLDEQDLPVDHLRIITMAERTAHFEKAQGEISITLVRNDIIAELNASFMNKTGPTDVLSFPIDGPAEFVAGGPPRMIGEIVLCPEVAAAQAQDGLDSELDLLTAHGVLHLLGYDHDTEDGAAAMRLREQDLTGRSGARAS